MADSADAVSPTHTPFANFDAPSNGMFTPARGSGTRNVPDVNHFGSSVFDTPPTPTENNVASSSGLLERRASRQEMASSPRPVSLQVVIPPSSPRGVNTAAETPNLAGQEIVGVKDGQPELEEVAREGQVIFENFIQQEVTAAGLTPPVNFSPVGTVSETATQTTASLMNIPTGGQIADATYISANNPHDLWFEHGRRLNEIAQQFKKSKERKAVLDQANTVDLNSITRQSFMSLLSGLFPESRITLEGIVTLFVFCRDLAVRLLVQNLPRYQRYFCDMMRWAVDFINRRLCRWVCENGGWGTILSSGLATAWNTGIRLRSVLAVTVLAMIGFYFFRKSNP